MVRTGADFAVESWLLKIVKIYTYLLAFMLQNLQRLKDLAAATSTYLGTSCDQSSKNEKFLTEHTHPFDRREDTST